MSFNQDFLYNKLPDWIIREDENQDLFRFIQWFTGKLDDADTIVDTLDQKVNPDTSTLDWIDWIAWAFFGWASWPETFTLQDKIDVLKQLADRLAGAGTNVGIESWLQAFKVTAVSRDHYAFVDDQYVADEPWMEPDVASVIRVKSVDDVFVLPGREFVDDSYVDDGIGSENKISIKNDFIEFLANFNRPIGHQMVVEYVQYRPADGPSYWDATFPVDEEIVPANG